MSKFHCTSYSICCVLELHVRGGRNEDQRLLPKQKRTWECTASSHPVREKTRSRTLHAEEKQKVTEKNSPTGVSREGCSSANAEDDISGKSLESLDGARSRELFRGGGRSRHFRAKYRRY